MCVCEGIAWGVPGHRCIAEGERKEPSPAPPSTDLPVLHGEASCLLPAATAAALKPHLRFDQLHGNITLNTAFKASATPRVNQHPHHQESEGYLKGAGMLGALVSAPQGARAPHADSPSRHTTAFVNLPWKVPVPLQGAQHSKLSRRIQAGTQVHTDQIVSSIYLMTFPNSLTCYFAGRGGAAVAGRALAGSSLCTITI